MLGDFRHRVQRIYLTDELAFHSIRFLASSSGMSESEAPVPSPSAISAAKPADDDRRRHRGRRGGRGRRKPEAGTIARQTPPPAESAPPAPAETAAPEPPARPASPAPAPAPAPSPAPEPKPLLQRIQRLTERGAVHRATIAEPAHHGSAISQAIDEVMEIVAALKGAVDQMEDVLELVELAERQKLGDEREIESLRRALRNVHQRPDSRRSADEPRRSGSDGRRSESDPRRSGNAPRRGDDEPRPSETESSPPED